MKEKSLREYHREIETLIEGGNVNEAIAHCQHILKTFPMNLDTYRLLGKSYLESRKYKEAADIFQRLLMSIPDDFVSHVGMSIIRDDEKDLEDSIWHMERAFEVQPSNPAIQEELKKLYGRRDGKPPSKIRLTRDALANMYTQGALYSQAINEIRSVLAEDPDRADLKVMLARAYSKDGRKKQAVDICSELLKKNPYCFDALVIVGDLLSSPENQQLVTSYRSRIFAMDPYAEHSSGSNFNSQGVPDNAVIVDYLDIQSDPTLSNTVNDQELLETSLSKEKEPIKNKQQSDLAGNEKGSDDLSNLDMNLDQIKPNAKADIPDWIKELAPEKSENGNVLEELEQTDDKPQERKDDPAEIEQSTTGSSAEELIEGSLEGIPGWLREMGTDELFKPDEIDESPEGTDLDISGDSKAIESEIPEWLEGEQNGSISSDIPIREPISEMDDYELPDWLKGIESEKDIDNLKSVDGFDLSMLVGSNEVASNNIPVEESEPGISTIPPIPEIEPELISSPEAGIDEGIDKTKGEVEDHDVFEKDSEIISEDGSTAFQEPDEALAGSVEITEESSTSPVPESMEQISDLNDADAAFAWLESLAARQGANPDELTSKPDDMDLEPPDWIKNAMEGESVNQIEGSVDPEEQIDHSYEEELSTFKESDKLAVSDSDVAKPQEQEYLEKETSEDVVSEQNEEGTLQKEDLNNLEESSELVRELRQEADTKSEANAWVPAKDSIAGGEEIETAGEVEEEIIPSGSAADDLPGEAEIEEAVKAEQPLGAGDWQPFEENDLDIGSDLLQNSKSDLIASDGEISQLSKVPAGGSLTKIPGKDVEKEADILETAQSFLGRRDLKNSLEEYRKLIKKGKLLEGVIHDLKEISYQYPIDVSVWQSLGDAYMRANQLQDALESYTKAEELLR